MSPTRYHREQDLREKVCYLQTAISPADFLIAAIKTGNEHLQTDEKELLIWKFPAKTIIKGKSGLRTASSRD